MTASPLSGTMSTEKIRSFISIDVEGKATLGKIGIIQTSLAGTGADLKLVKGEDTHVTMKFLGDIDPGMLSAVKKALGQVRFPAFELEVRGVGAFPSLSRISIIWVGIGEGAREVEEIYDQVERYFGELGFKREARGFNPHITIARVRTGRRKEELVRVLGEFADQSLGTFRADRVRLKQSKLQHSGPEYLTLYEMLASP